MQDKTWYSILGLDAEPLFLQEGMLNEWFHAFFAPVPLSDVTAREIDIWACKMNE